MTGYMETIKVQIDFDRTFGAASEQVPGCVAVSSSLKEVKEAYTFSLAEHFAAMAADGEAVPANYEVVFEVSTQALLQSYKDVISLAAISRATGINRKLLGHYAQGLKKPRATQREKIIQGFHTIAAELAAVQRGHANLVEYAEPRTNKYSSNPQQKHLI